MTDASSSVEFSSLKGIPIEHQTLELCRVMVDMNPFDLEFAHFQDLEMCKQAIERIPDVIVHAKYTTNDIIINAIKRAPTIVTCLPNVTTEQLEVAIHANPWLISAFPSADRNLQLIAVNENHEAVKCIRCQLPEIRVLSCNGRLFQANHFRTHSGKFIYTPAEIANMQLDQSVKDYLADTFDFNDPSSQIDISDIEKSLSDPLRNMVIESKK